MRSGVPIGNRSLRVPALAMMLIAAPILQSRSGCAETRAALRFDVTGPVEEVFVYTRDRCEPWDAPDMPARALRSNSGELRLFDANDRNRALVGHDFGRLRRDCAVPFEAGR